MEPSDWIVVGVVAVLIVGGCTIQAVSTFGSEPAEGFYLNDTMSRAMDEALEQAPRPPPDEFWRMTVVPLKNDRNGKMAKSLQETFARFEDGAKYRGPDPDYVAGELQKDFKGPMVVETEAEAQKVGLHLGLDVVVWGRVDAAGDKPDVTEAVFQVIFERMPARDLEPQAKVLGKVQVERRLSKSVGSLDYVRLRLSQTSTVFRVILWFVIAAGLPFLFYPVALKLFEYQSNGANMTLLVALVVSTLAAAFALNGVAFSATWVVLYAGLLLASAAYNLALLNAFQESD